MADERRVRVAGPCPRRDHDAFGADQRYVRGRELVKPPLIGPGHDPVCQPGQDVEIAYRKVSRILRVHFRSRRVATVGPDLSHRRTLINQVLRAPAVRRVIAAEGEGEE